MKKLPKNYCIRYLFKHGQNVEQWTYYCADLTNNVVAWLELQNIEIEDRMWIESKYDFLRPHYYPNLQWRYHIVIQDKEGYIHDAWCAQVLTLNDYLNIMFPQQLVSTETFKKINSTEE